jgi:hypothetical protein
VTIPAGILPDVLTSVLASIRGSGKKYDSGKTFRNIADRYQLTGVSTINQLYDIVRNVRAADRSAARVNDSDPFSVTRNSTPYTSLFDPSRGKYGYRVLITITDTSNMQTSSTYLDVYSDTQLTLSQIQSAAQGVLQRVGPAMPPPPPLRNTGQTYAYEYTPIATGRTFQ